MTPTRLSLRRRIALEADRILWRKKVKEHRLHTLFWESTWRCNAACLHCGSDCTCAPAIPDMPKEEFLRVIDSLTPHVDPSRLLVIISGGEPLVRPDLEEIGLELYRRGYPWGIVTNAIALTPARLESLRRAGMRTVSVSLDGLEADHNWLRGNPLCYARATQAIASISRCPDLASDVITCVNSRNLSTLPRLRALLAELGVRRWRLFTIFPSGRAKAHPELFLDPTQYRSLMRFIADTRRLNDGGPLPSYCCEGFLGQWEGEVRDRFYHCSAGIGVASIRIDGSIGACASIRSDYSQGNIRTDDFWEVWTTRFRPFRDRAWMRTGPCAACSMWRYCQGNGLHLRDSSGALLRCNLADLTAPE